MRRIALGVCYEGTPWLGWQSQAGGNTVQDVLEQALGRFTAQPVSTICAGRTDTGVHALNQVVHLDTAAERSLESWVRGLNALLPDSVAVQWAREVPDDFHRSEEHTSELQSRENLVCRLLLEKKKR